MRRRRATFDPSGLTPALPLFHDLVTGYRNSASTSRFSFDLSDRERAPASQKDVDLALQVLSGEESLDRDSSHSRQTRPGSHG